MRKSKIISLTLVLALIVGLFVGCHQSTTLSKQDVEANPAAYIEDGLKKSFSKSPFGDLIALQDPEAVSLVLSMVPTTEEGYIKFDAVISNKALAILANLDADLDGEQFKGSIFIDKENLAISTEPLKDIFGTESVGISLKDFINNLKQSNWYKLLIIDSGLEEELKTEEGADIDLQAIVNLFADFIKKVEQIYKESIKYDVVERIIEADGVAVEGYKIIQTQADDVTDKFVDAAEKFVEDLRELLPSEIGEDLDVEMDSLVEDIASAIEEMTVSADIEYFIAKNGGAVIEIRYAIESTMIDEWTEEEVTSSTNFVIHFGANPEEVFSPQFKLQMMEDGVKFTVNGMSTMSKETKTFNLDLDAKISYPEEYELADETINAKIEFGLDGRYNATFSSGDEQIEIDGEFKVDGTKLHFTTTIEDVEIVIDVDFNAQKPIAFEYDDILKWDEEKIQSLLESIYGSYEEDYYDPYDYE